MTDKNFGEIKSIVSDAICESVSGGSGRISEQVLNSMANKFTDRILAALEKEREGEVVLWTGEMGGIGLYVPPIPGVEGNHGQIIFRPTKAEKGGE